MNKSFNHFIPKQVIEEKEEEQENNEEEDDRIKTNLLNSYSSFNYIDHNQRENKQVILNNEKYKRFMKPTKNNLLSQKKTKTKKTLKIN